MKNALTLAALASLLLLESACGPAAEAPAPLPVPVPVAAVAPTVKAKTTARKRIASAKPAEARAERGARLQDPGEAFGGRPPVRVDKSTPAAQ